MEPQGIPKSIFDLAKRMEDYMSCDRGKITEENAFAVVIPDSKQGSPGYFLKRDHTIVGNNKLYRCSSCKKLFVDELAGIRISSTWSNELCPECMNTLFGILAQTNFEEMMTSKEHFEMLAKDQEEEEDDDDDPKDGKRKRSSYSKNVALSLQKS